MPPPIRLAWNERPTSAKPCRKRPRPSSTLWTTSEPRRNPSSLAASSPFNRRPGRATARGWVVPVVSGKRAPERKFYESPVPANDNEPESHATPGENDRRYDGNASGPRVYAYVGDDPINAIDPTGMDPEEIIVTGTLDTGNAVGLSSNAAANGGPREIRPYYLRGMVIYQAPVGDAQGLAWTLALGIGIGEALTVPGLLLAEAKADLGSTTGVTGAASAPGQVMALTDLIANGNGGAASAIMQAMAQTAEGRAQLSAISQTAASMIPGASSSTAANALATIAQVSRTLAGSVGH